MRTYETIFIVHPEITGDAYQQMVDKYKNILVQQNAEIHKFDEWGVKRLAYQLGKQTKGSYVLAVFDCLPGALVELERRLRLDEGILKYQSVHIDKFTPVELQPKPAAPSAEGGEGEKVPESPEEGENEMAEEEEED